MVLPILQETGSFENYKDSQGNLLISFNRDGSISQSDGQKMITRNSSVVTVPASKILTMFTAPVLLVSGLANNIIMCTHCLITYNFVSTAFNPGASDVISFVTGGTTLLSFDALLGGIRNIAAVGFVDQTQSMFAEMDNSIYGSDGTSAATVPASPLSGISGGGLYVVQYNNSGSHTYPTGANWTLGNSTLTFYLEYCYVPV